jgi:hypothetical protein
MKEDREYAKAVLRLRTRECTLDDLDLFNSCVIKSATNPNGVDMGSPENLHASAIIKTNALREVLNITKAKANCSSTSADDSAQELIICGANDIIKGLTNIEPHKYKSLLRLDFTHSRAHHSLPGFVPLYIGMPVVLHMRNLSTDLKITNGAQGIVRHIITKVLSHGISHCTCAIVEFPDSPIKLSGLPTGFYPITPCHFHSQLILTKQRSMSQDINGQFSLHLLLPDILLRGREFQRYLHHYMKRDMQIMSLLQEHLIAMASALSNQSVNKT